MSVKWELSVGQGACHWIGNLVVSGKRYHADTPRYSPVTNDPLDMLAREMIARAVADGVLIPSELTESLDRRLSLYKEVEELSAKLQGRKPEPAPMRFP